MLLRFLATSPYVRKVMVLALEAGLGDRIEKVPTSPQADEDSLIEHNPLSKVPTLVCDDGTVLYDSPVVCEYLDTLHDGPRFFPEGGKARWTALRRQALADGILDALVLRRYEGMRPAELRSGIGSPPRPGRSNAASMPWKRKPRRKPWPIPPGRSPSVRSPSPAPWDTWTSGTPTTIGVTTGRRWRPGSTMPRSGPRSRTRRPLRPDAKSDQLRLRGRVERLFGRSPWPPENSTLRSQSRRSIFSKTKRRWTRIARRAPRPS